MARSFLDIARSRVKSKGLDLRTKAGKQFLKRSVASQKGHRRRKTRETRKAKKDAKEKKISKELKARILRAVSNWTKGSELENRKGRVVALDRLRNVAVVEIVFKKGGTKYRISVLVDLDTFRVFRDRG